jgi:Leucine-rich repeat (LRR) protein
MAPHAAAAEKKSRRPSSGGSSSTKKMIQSKTATFPTALFLLLCCLPTVITAQKSQANILEIFYDQANGDNWTYKQWDITDTNVCNSASYPGVTCNDDKKIIEIDLHDNGLSGKVTPWIYALPHLTKLALENNDIDDAGWDQISDVQDVKELGFVLGEKLKEIVLTSNKISSVKGIDKLADSLEALHLTYNRVSGPMPKELFSLKNLKVLSISENDISGTIDQRLGGLTDLKEFYCYGNKFEGHIPMEIGQLVKLQILTVSLKRYYGLVQQQKSGGISLYDVFGI